MAVGYATRAEVIAWALSVNPDRVPRNRRMTKEIMHAYNRAHPDRPYDMTSAWSRGDAVAESRARGVANSNASRLHFRQLGEQH